MSAADEKPWLIKPGEVRNPKGRGKGNRARLGEAFLEALHEDFKSHGVKAIQVVREERPQDYLKVVASILPKELNVNTTALGDMSDDELTATLVALRDLASTLDGAIAGAGSREASGEEPASELPAVH